MSEVEVKINVVINLDILTSELALNLAHGSTFDVQLPAISGE
jgi:hypothetical protein